MLLYKLEKDRQTVSAEKVNQLVLPAEFRRDALKSPNSDMGHLGVEQTTYLLFMRLYKPKMAMEAEQCVKTCGKCVMRKKHLARRQHPLHRIVSSC